MSKIREETRCARRIKLDSAVFTVCVLIVLVLPSLVRLWTS